MDNNQAVIEQVAQETARKIAQDIDQQAIAGEQAPKDGQATQRIFFQVGRQGDVVVLQFSQPVKDLGMTAAVAREMLNKLRDAVNGIQPVRMRHKRK